jgi:hypothetical protein
MLALLAQTAATWHIAALHQFTMLPAGQQAGSSNM